MQREDVLQLDRLFNARLPAVPLSCLATRPSLSSGEWRAHSFTVADAYGASSSAARPSTEEELKQTEQLLADLNLLVRKAYVRVLWEIRDRHLHLAVYLVPHDLPNLRKSGIRLEDREKGSTRTALRRLYKQLYVRDQPLLHQVRSSDTLLHAWNAVPSPPCRASFAGLEGHDWLKDKLDQLYNEEQPFGLAKTLYPYQRNDVAALLCAEGVPRMQDDVTYTPLTDELGAKFWINVDFQLKKRVGRYPAPSGGIIANMPGSGKSLELISLISASKNRIAPLRTELTGYGPFIPQLETDVPSPSRYDTSPVPTLLQSCVRLIREKVALTAEDAERLAQTSAAPLLTRTEMTFERPPPELFEHLDQPSHRSSRRINSGYDVKYLSDFNTSTFIVSKTSLLVVPQNLLQHWEDEIRSGSQVAISYAEAKSKFGGKDMCNWTPEEVLWAEGQFLWTVLKEADHKKGFMRPTELARFDLILMSDLIFQKQAMQDEPETNGVKAKVRSPLRQLHFMRMAFDEAVFSTSKETTRGFILASRLSSHARWTISATPTKNLTQHHEDLQTVERPLDETLKNKQDEDDLDRLGRAAAFLKMLPFATDKALFKHWITEAFVLGYGYASASTFLNQVVVRTHPEDIRTSIALPHLETRVEILPWAYLDRLSYNVMRALFCANSILTEKEGTGYFFDARNRGARNDLLTNIAESHTALFSPDLLGAAQGAIKNITEKLAKESTTEDMKIELQPVLHFLVEAHDSVTWKQACQANDLCYIVKGQCEAVSNSFDVQASYMGRSGVALEGGSLMSATRISELLFALEELRRKLETEEGSWKDGEELDEELATVGLKQIKDQETAAQPKQKKPPKKTIDIDLADKSPEKKKTGRTSPRKTAQRKPNTKEKKAKAKPPPQPRPKREPKKAPNPLRALPEDSSLQHSQIITSTSSKVNFIVEQVVGSSENDAFIIFSEAPLALYNVATALRFCNVTCAYQVGATSTQRDAYIKTFKQENGPKVLLISPQHGGRGLHLTRANRIIFLSPTWQKDDEAQATLRSHRIGQTKPVLVQILVMKDSFEADLLSRRNQLNSSQQNAQAQHHLKSEADDHELRWKLEHATFIKPQEGETDLANFNRWTLSRPLVLDARARQPANNQRQNGGDTSFDTVPETPQRESASSEFLKRIPETGSPTPGPASTSTAAVPMAEVLLRGVKRERDESPRPGVLVYPQADRPLKKVRKAVAFG